MRKYLSLLIGLSTVALAASLTITDGLRRSVTLETPVSKVVALSPTAVEVMLDVGITPVGRPSSAVHPEAAKRIAEVGSAYRPDPEKILGLQPDLLLGSVGTTAGQAKALEALKIPLLVSADSSLKDVIEMYALVGKLTGKEAMAQTAGGRLERAVAAVVARVPKTGARPKVLALLAAGGQSFSTTDETYAGDLLERLAAINVAKGTPSADPRQPGFVVLSLEQIVASNPDVILALRPRTASGAFAPSPLERLESQPVWQNLNAVKNNRVHLLDADPIVTAPGPRAVESLEMLLPLLYPGAK